MAILEVRNLSKSFGGLEVLKDISFDVEKGCVTAIIGPSGSGKSTLLRCVNQLERAGGGTVSVCGMELIEDYKNGKPVYASSDTLRAIRLKIGLVFQNFNLFPHMSVMRNITEAPMCVLKKSKQEAEKTALELLEKMGLSGKADSYPCELSGGQQQSLLYTSDLGSRPRTDRGDTESYKRACKGKNDNGDSYPRNGFCPRRR